MSRFDVGDIRGFRPAVVEGVALRLEQQRRVVARAMSRLLAHSSFGGTASGFGDGAGAPVGPAGSGAGGGGGGSSSGSWGGDAAQAAARDVAAKVDELEALAEGLGVGAQTIRELGRRLSESQALLRVGENEAGARGGWVSSGGEVRLPVRVPTGDTLVDAATASADAWTRQSVARSVAAAQAVAARADDEARRRLADAVRGASVVSGVTDLSMVAAPPSIGRGQGPDGAAFEAAAWWRSLTGEERGLVVSARPEWVGSLDGVPAVVRHQANLVLLARAERAAQSELRAALAARGHPLGSRTRLEKAQEVVDSLRAVRDVLGQRDGQTRHLLLIDTSGPVVQVVTAVGDVDRAGHIATWVGGFTTHPRNDLVRMDTTFTRMRAMTRSLTRERGSEGDVAVVTWMGYAAPQVREVGAFWGRSVLRSDIARSAGAPLGRFVEGLDASRRSPAHQTIWAHSYGSVVAAEGLQRQRRVDDVVLFGSPGTPLTATCQAGLKAGAMNVMVASRDPIAHTGWFVNKPHEVPGFTELATGHFHKPVTNELMRASSGHSEYFLPGSTSEHNLAAVAAGRPDLRVREGQWLASP